MNYGLIGEHLPHSFSKEIHGRIGGYDYQLKELAPEELDGFLKAKDFLGINVTIPYKQAVIPYLDEISEAARKIGAVNTIVNRGGKLSGYNTDFGGMRSLILREGIEVSGKKVLILGTGGTSRTATAAADSLGAREIYRVSRTGREGSLTYEEAYAQHGDAGILINCTPCGMFPHPEDAPCDLNRFPNVSGIVDAIYNPLRTRLVQQGLEKGIPSSGGLYMLAAQAVLAAEYFLDTTYDHDMIESIYRALAAEKENIVLIGMPACGKTTVGNILAETTGRKLIDTDAWIVEKQGRSIPDIFSSEGEAAFRDMETEAVREISRKTGAIIATGGGAILRPENVSALKQNGRLYFLDRPVEELIPTKGRPTANSMEAIRRRYEERSPIYHAVADETIRHPASAKAAAQEILDRCRQ